MSKKKLGIDFTFLMGMVASILFVLLIFTSDLKSLGFLLLLLIVFSSLS
ncbi:hypothetical protein J2T56_000228 [Natronobacillus azotifigens]